MTSILGQMNRVHVESYVFTISFSIVFPCKFMSSKYVTFFGLSEWSFIPNSFCLRSAFRIIKDLAKSFYVFEWEFQDILNTSTFFLGKRTFYIIKVKTEMVEGKRGVADRLHNILK
jgi:hypothetical protein